MVDKDKLSIHKIVVFFEILFSHTLCFTSRVNFDGSLLIANFTFSPDPILISTSEDKKIQVGRRRSFDLISHMH